jgi:hypothetical protein
MAIKETELPDPIDPMVDIVEDDVTTADGKKKRGRKPGGKNSDSASYGRKKAGMDIDALAANLRAIHELMALGTGIGIMRLDEKEAKGLATAVSNLAAQYDMVLDPRTVAWINLLGVAASIYGPRILMIKAAQSMARQQAEQAAWNQAGVEKTVN